MKKKKKKEESETIEVKFDAKKFEEPSSPTSLKSIMKKNNSPRSNKSPLRFREPTKPFEITMNELNISEKSNEDIMTPPIKKRMPSR